MVRVTKDEALTILKIIQVQKKVATRQQDEQEVETLQGLQDMVLDTGRIETGTTYAFKAEGRMRFGLWLALDTYNTFLLATSAETKDQEEHRALMCKVGGNK